MIFAQVIVLFEGTGKFLSLHEPVRGASVFSKLIFNPEEMRKCQLKKGGLKRGTQILLESLLYHRHIVRVCTQRWLY